MTEKEAMVWDAMGALETAADSYHAATERAAGLKIVRDDMALQAHYVGATIEAIGKLFDCSNYAVTQALDGAKARQRWERNRA